MTADRAAAPDAVLPDPARFVATTTIVDAAEWPAAEVAHAADTGIVVAGRERLLAATGVATTLPLPRGLEDEGALLAVHAWLAAVDRTTRDDRTTREDSSAAVPDAGPVALGAFAFDRGAPTRLTVASTTWCRDSAGRTWRVDVRRRDPPRGGGTPGTRRRPGDARTPDAGRCADDGGPTVAASSGARDVHTPKGPPTGSATVRQVRQVPPPAAYADAVERAVADIRSGKLRKVVLGRLVEVGLPVPSVPSDVLLALWGGEEAFSPFSVPTPNGRLVGASPELLVGRHGTSVVSHAFAGTLPLSHAASDSKGDADADVRRLLESVKDREEHRLAVEDVAAALERRCVALTVPAEPTVVRLRSDARLGTLIRGTLASAQSGGDTALSLLALLHPTPAVGGVPRAVALEEIAELEASPRGYWAGAVGWADGTGDGEWVLAIRSVELDGLRARVRAGAGIVERSEPQAELAETTVKLFPVLEALWPGAGALLRARP